MRLKPGVDARAIHPGIWFYLGIIAAEHRRWTGEELWVTDLRRLPGERPSRHAPKRDEEVTAADFRRWSLDAHARADAFCRMLQSLYGDELGVVLEPEWLSPEERDRRGGLLKIDPHVHVQLKAPGYPRV